MPKRSQQSYTKQKSFKKKPKKDTRPGYSSVSRTRGGQVLGETKYFDTEKQFGAIVASASWTGTMIDPATFNTLCVPQVGAGVNQRIGKQIMITKLKLRGHIQCPAQSNQTVADAPTKVRIILVLDKQTNSAQMTGTQLMQTVTNTENCVNSFQNIDNFGRFIVLKDKVITMESPTISYDGTNVEQSGLIRNFKIDINFKKPVKVRFNATNGGTIADIVDNSLHMVAVSSNTDLAPNICYNCRVCYKE